MMRPRSLTLLLLALTALAACKQRAPAAQLRDAEPPSTEAVDLEAWGKLDKCIKHPYNQLLATALTPEEEAAVRKYQDTGYKQINRALREATFDYPEWRNAASLVLGSIAKQKPLPKSEGGPLKVYRTYQSDARWVPVPKAGETFEASGFVSTTFNDSFGSGEWVFDERDLMKIPSGEDHLAITITIPAGARGLAMNSLGDKSMHPKECELLLAHKARFRVETSELKAFTFEQRKYKMTLQSWTLVNDGFQAASLASAPVQADGLALTGGAPPPDVASRFQDGTVQGLRPVAADPSDLPRGVFEFPGASEL